MNLFLLILYGVLIFIAPQKTAANVVGDLQMEMNSSSSLISSPLHPPNYLSSLLRSIPDEPDHIPLSKTQLKALQKYAKLGANVYCGLMRPGAYRCDAYCSEFPNMTLVEYFAHKPYDVNGYIARDDQRKAIVIAFRGALSLLNWVAICSLKMTAYPRPNLIGGRVHAGAYRAYKSSRDKLIPKLLEQLHNYPNYEVEVLGHSLGAMIATLHALDLWEKGIVPEDNLYLITFGGPRVGNGIFSNYSSNAGFLSKRLVNKGDIIVHMFPRIIGYRHSANEIHTNSRTGLTIQCKKAEDPLCSNGESRRYSVLDHQYFLGVGFLITCLSEAIVHYLKQVKYAIIPGAH
ncbi:uncharacterized protein VTP21DRAFT_8029 [Calcarisporiella thermophila]|uniref:uncharacterized protein n=1 Tax=Calcarisporiella thermophila TaxID=911321 RepID=UPI0037428F76